MKPDLLFRAGHPLPEFPVGACGVDEAGRGPLAGPVVAAAVILRPGDGLDEVRDSKTLTPERREVLAQAVRERALSWSLGEASVEEIDRLNILQATLLAMKRALDGLSIRPAEVWVDGLHAPAIDLPTRAVIQGDQRVKAISAASILAKTARDATLRQLAQRYPEYGFERHKGYGSPEHLERLHRYGPCPHHRRSFAPLRQWLLSQS
ncbi:MAG: ribonuclease HII [Ferrovum sp.]|nr:ribonuclease HII [Ferrovum sp.]NDU86924.1 ribonuclease HII [Ferrovum sp.]